MREKEIISIDLGSNSFRVLKYDCIRHKNIGDYHEVVGLADGLVNTGLISKEAQQRVIDAIKKAQEKLKFNSRNVIAVTTAAMRNAKNSLEVLKYFKETTGIEFKIIDGIEEARMTLLAVKYALKREQINSSNFILLDIGGGSTELIVNKDEKFFSKSFDFGIVTMAQSFNHLKDIQDDLNNKKLYIKTFLDTLSLDLKDFIFVATAGTPTTVAAIKLGQNYFSYDKNIVNGTIVNLDDLSYCLELFKSLSEEEINQLVGKKRFDFVKVGILIYQIIFEVLEKKESIVLDDGLREGVAIDYTLK